MLNRKTGIIFVTLSLLMCFAALGAKKPPAKPPVGGPEPGSDIKLERVPAMSPEK